MMHTLNVRLAAICLAVVVLLGGGVHLLHGYQVHRLADAYKVASERAKADFVKLRTACVALRGSLSPADRLTVASEQTEEQKKLRLAEEKDRAEAVRVLESYFGPQPNRKELLHQGWLEEEKNLDEAIRLLGCYLHLEPKDQKEHLHLGMLYAEKPDPRAVVVVYPRVVRVTNPKAANDALEEVVRKADASLSPEELRTARRTLVDMAMLIGRAPDAETHLKALMEETPDDPELLDTRRLDTHGQKTG